MMCFHLFCFSCETEAGPVTRYVNKCVYDISFFLFFFEYSTYVWNKRIFLDVVAQNLKNDQFQLSSLDKVGYL